MGRFELWDVSRYGKFSDGTFQEQDVLYVHLTPLLQAGTFDPIPAIGFALSEEVTVLCLTIKGDGVSFNECLELPSLVNFKNS